MQRTASDAVLSVPPMDAYTATTREWLEGRYQRHASGYYVPHQPIHGIEAARETGVLRDYVRVHHIVRALAHLSFSSLLDVGAAEGYVPALARHLFQASVRGTDLSGEVCSRARELFEVEASPADIQALPFADDSFDVVVCSETIEHVVDLDAARRELLRVARNAVIVTVPHESPEAVRAQRESGEPHAHIHAFARDSFDHWSDRASAVHTAPILSAWTRHAFALLEARELSPSSGGAVRAALRGTYDRVRPVLRRMPARRLVEALIELDEPLCRSLPGHDGILAIIEKRPGHLASTPRVRVTAATLVDFHARTP